MTEPFSGIIRQTEYEEYQVDLEVLQYDMLYGKRYVYGEDGETPYERVKLQMGALPVTLERIEKSGEDTWYFTEKTLRHRAVWKSTRRYRIPFMSARRF